MGSVRNYADLFNNKTESSSKQKNAPKSINHQLYSPGEVEPKTGDFVRFKNLSSSVMVRFNGKLGLIKNNLGGSRFQVMTMNNPNDFSVLVSNFDVIKNCNSEYNRMEIGEMVWPKLKGSTSPNNHWVKDRVLTGLTMMLFDALNFYKFDEVHENFGYAESMPKSNKFKKYVTDRLTAYERNDNFCLKFFMNQCQWKDALPGFWSEFQKKYSDRVKEVFGWSKPVVLRSGTRNDDEAQLIIVCYDENSKGPVNEWFGCSVPDDKFESYGSSRFSSFRSPVHKECCGFNLNNPDEIRGPFIIIKAITECYTNDRLYSEGFWVQTFDRISDISGDPSERMLSMLEETDVCPLLNTEDERTVFGWYGKLPFHKLNDTKLMYCRNRYLLPNILTKAKDENTDTDIFNAKNSFSRAKTARKIASDHSCRTGCCVACEKLKDSMRTKVVALKTNYNGVKSGNAKEVESESDSESDNTSKKLRKHIKCECCQNYREWEPKVVQFGNEMRSDVVALTLDEQLSIAAAEKAEEDEERKIKLASIVDSVSEKITTKVHNVLKSMMISPNVDGAAAENDELRKKIINMINKSMSQNVDGAAAEKEDISVRESLNQLIIQESVKEIENLFERFEDTTD